MERPQAGIVEGRLTLLSPRLPIVTVAVMESAALVT